MKRPQPEQGLFPEDQKFYPYFAAVGGLLAVIVGIWPAIEIPYLILAADIGRFSFVVVWFGVRRHRYVAAVPAVLVLIAWPMSCDLLLSRRMSSGISSLCDLQALGVWMFVFGALYLAFREKPKIN